MAQRVVLSARPDAVTDSFRDPEEAPQASQAKPGIDVLREALVPERETAGPPRQSRQQHLARAVVYGALPDFAIKGASKAASVAACAAVLMRGRSEPCRSPATRSVRRAD